MSHATDEDVATGIASISSMPSTGLETPDTIDLRKRSATERSLYQVLEQQEASVGGALMGSSHTYVIPGAAGALEHVLEKDGAKLRLFRLPHGAAKFVLSV